MRRRAVGNCGCVAKILGAQSVAGRSQPSRNVCCFGTDVYILFDKVKICVNLPDNGHFYVNLEGMMS